MMRDVGKRVNEACLVMCTEENQLEGLLSEKLPQHTETFNLCISVLPAKRCIILLPSLFSAPVHRKLTAFNWN